MSRNFCSTLTLIAGLIGFSSMPLASSAQVNVTNALTPQQLVQDVLAGPGVTISNVVYNGVPSPPTPQVGSGEFTTGTTNLGIGTGIILSSGSALDVGQAAGNFASTDLNGGSDPDLVAISGNPSINDAAILEFDFVPLGDTLDFSYVFGSEEYPEFVCSINDAFGFFLSGPGIVGPYTNNAINIATLPGSGLPVTIDNVNNGLNNNPNDPNCPANNPTYYVDNSAGTTVVYDGFTVVLQARSFVQCGQTYHIKLAIGDASDGIYDSGVFLQEGSFQSNAVQVEVGGSVSGDSSIVEGCSQALITFVRPDTAGIDTIIYDIDGNAINGVDFNFITDTVIFAGGVDSVAIDIIPIDDGIADGPDTLIITAYTITVCGDTLIDTGIIYIVDSIPFDVLAPDIDVFCPTDSVTISATALGDPMDHSYVWSTGQTDSVINVVFNGLPTDTVFVSVTDTCGNSTTMDTVVIHNLIAPPPIAEAGPDTTVGCAFELINLNASVTNGTGPFSYSWSTGSTGQNTTYALPTTMYITVTITDACGMQTTDSLLATVAPIIPDIVISPDTSVQCPGDPVILNVSGQNGTPPYVYTWSTGSNANQIQVTPTVSTWYVVELTDICSPVPVLDSVFVFVPTVDPITDGFQNLTVDCPGDLVTLDPEAAGGSGQGFTYTWDDGTTAPTYVVTANSTGTYTVIVEDVCGPTETFQVTVTVPNYDPILVATSDEQTICDGTSTAIAASVTGGGGGNVYTWTGTGTIEPSNTINTTVTPILSPSIYTITVVDQCGNVGSADATVLTEACAIYPPNVISPNGDGHNDAFVVLNIERWPENNVKIMNRWGKTILDQDNYKNDWKATGYSEGTYFYIITINDTDEPMTGTLTVVR